MKTTKPLILLVDHSRGALMFQETVLRRREKVVASALSGREGLEKLRNDRPRLVILGYELHDMTAPEFCREVRNAAHSKATSLLFVADRQASDQVDLCMAAGCNDVIFRPLHIEELDGKVEKLTAIRVRRELRTLTRIDVNVDDGGGYILGHSQNISANGMLLETEHVLPPEASITVHFYLSGELVPFDLDAGVIRAEFTGGVARYGIRFRAMASADSERIVKFVQRLRTRELH